MRTLKIIGAVYRANTEFLSKFNRRRIVYEITYKKFSSIVGEDLIKNPDFALRPRVAARILVEGSLKGMFTGRKLSDYIKTGSTGEFVEARRVINGVDKASLIASHAVKFLDCLVIEKV